MNKTYMVRLTDAERHEFVQLTKSGKTAASKIKHAHILLHVDANGPRTLIKSVVSQEARQCSAS
jgi:hypothetical protein